MDEIVIISGKGGTGKTSLTASLAFLARSALLADCDVDAPNLALLLAPEVLERASFTGGRKASIRSRDCTACGRCLEECRFDAVRNPEPGRYAIDGGACEGCGVCVRFCPAEAIDFEPEVSGEWMISSTRCGSMVHARLHPGGENSGKLVSLVRQKARQLAEAEGSHLVLVDGPPGVGCPVIASVTGASRVLVVTEPTVAGVHDMERVLQLARHFTIPASVCVNKWDINPEMSERIEAAAAKTGADVVGHLRYDPGVTAMQMEGRAPVEAATPIAEDIRRLWARLEVAE